MITRPSILSFGEVVWDCYSAGRKFGGAPANFACQAAQLGCEVSLLSSVGDDEDGETAITELSTRGVDTSFVQIHPQVPTGKVIVSKGRDGSPSYDIVEPAAWDLIDYQPEIDQKLNQVDAVYFGTLSQRSDMNKVTLQRLLDRAAEASIPRILDINLRRPFFDHSRIRESVERASILKLSDEELPAVAEACSLTKSEEPAAALQELSRSFDLSAVALTMGEKGAVLVTPDEVFIQSVPDVEVIDTVGAGDAFTAALIVGLLEKPTAEILPDACAFAALACTHRGALPT